MTPVWGLFFFAFTYWLLAIGNQSDQSDRAGLGVLEGLGTLKYLERRTMLVSKVFIPL